MVVTAGIGQRASVAVTTLVGFPVVLFCAEDGFAVGQVFVVTQKDGSNSMSRSGTV